MSCSRSRRPCSVCVPLNSSRSLDGAAAVLPGARSFAAIAEWAANTPQPIRAAPGARHDPLAGGFLVPTETTIRRTPGRLDAHALAAAVGDRLVARDRHDQPRPAQRPR